MGMMDRMFSKITGRDAEKQPGSSEIRQKEDPAFAKTELSSSFEEQWDSRMATQAQSIEDQAKVDELRKMIADKQAYEGLKTAYGSKEKYMKAVQESTKALQQQFIAKEELERQQIAEQKKAQLEALKSRVATMGIDKDLDLWQQRQAEEAARRERLDLE